MNAVLIQRISSKQVCHNQKSSGANSDVWQPELLFLWIEERITCS